MAKKLHNGPKQKHSEQDPSSNRLAAKIGRCPRRIKQQHYKFSTFDPHALNEDAISHFICNDTTEKPSREKDSDNTDRKLHMIPFLFSKLPALY